VSVISNDPTWTRRLAGGRETSEGIRCFDWSSTPLGPFGQWPESLREAVAIGLRSRFQLAINSRRQLVLLYNDVGREVLGSLHPHALGQPAAGILAEVWEIVGPMPRGVLTPGFATWSVDQPLPINRHGFLRESFLTYSDSPAPDEDRPKDEGLSVFFRDVSAPERSDKAVRWTRDRPELLAGDRTRQPSQADAGLGRQVAKRQHVERARTHLLQRLVHAQEAEHRRIARELHDDLTQRLAVLAIDAGMLERLPGCPPNVAEKARDMREQLVTLSESVHSLSRQLHPSILDDLGLVDALRSECLSVGQRDGVAVRYRARGVPPDLPRDVALCVYRVAQEALRNVGRHARCGRAAVRLVADGRELTLRVRDQGIGFEVAARRKAGVGLESMRERARLVQARLTVRSRPGAGTAVTVRVPLRGSRT
jgi:signal transduction histidine kinase